MTPKMEITQQNTVAQRWPTRSMSGAAMMVPMNLPMKAKDALKEKRSLTQIQ